MNLKSELLLYLRERYVMINSNHGHKKINSTAVYNELTLETLKVLLIMLKFGLININS